MRLTSLLLVACLLLGACASVLPPVAIPPIEKRAKPEECRTPAELETVRAACRFRPEVWNTTADDQAAFIRACVEVLGPAYREEVRRRRSCVEWIDRD
jgi:hypothetical protein